MNFLALMVAYLVSQSLSGHGEPVSGWTVRWFQLLKSWPLNRKVQLAIFALLPVLVLFVLLYWVDNWLLNFVISIPVLMLAFKTGDQPEQLQKYRTFQAEGEEQAAWNVAVAELGLEQQLYEPGDEHLDEGVQAGLAYQYLERFFVTVFWYMAFGAPGVLLVFLVTTVIHANQGDAFINRVRHALFWFPVRLMAFTLALMGSFSHCFPGWLDQMTEFEKDDRVLLVSCLNTAVGQVNKEVLLEESIALIKRAQWAWLVALALILIFG